MGFSFGAGNAAKLLRAPLYAAGRLVTALVPRRSDRWVIGSAVGVSDGGLALWEQLEAHQRPALWLTSTAAHRERARARGIPTAPVHSLRGFWETARAGVLIVTHGLGDVNRYATGGAIIVQLWHGIPLKRIGLDAPETMRMAVLPDSRLIRALMRVLYRSTMRSISLLPASSGLVRGRLESAFGLPEGRVLETGEPRVDVLSRGSEQQRRDRALVLLSEAWGRPPGPGQRVVLYAPTWRDGDPDPAVPTPAEWEAIIALLERHDAVLAVRSHPLGAGRYAPPETSRVRSLGSDVLADVTPVLPAVDVLVTDYSSLVYDAALVAVPFLALAPDLEEYETRRGFYGRYADVAGPDPARSWGELLVELEGVLDRAEEYESRRATARLLSDSVHRHRDGRNTERVHDAITALVAERYPHDPAGRRRTRRVAVLRRSE